MTSTNRQVSDNLQSLCRSKTTQISFKLILVSYLFKLDSINVPRTYSLRQTHWFFKGRHESKIRGSKIAVRKSTRAFWSTAQLFCEISASYAGFFRFFDRVVELKK